MVYLQRLTLVVGIWWSVGICQADGPEVTRIEPPNWWADHSINPVRLLLTGQNLSGASVTSHRGLSVSNVSVSTSGNYLFCDVHVASGTRPGLRKLRLENEAGRTMVDFEITPAPIRTGKLRGFSPEDVIYLIMPDRFANGDTMNDDPAVSPGLFNRSRPRDYHGGDLQGVIDRLPYLRELGVTALWLTPWYENVNHPNTKEKYTRENHRSPDGIPSTDYHGYGPVDFYGVEEHFGDMAKLRELVDAAHAQGLKVIQDQIANHTGPYHPWVKNPPTPTWFNGTEAEHLDNSWQTWTLAERNPPPAKLKSTLEGWFINILPDLNQNDPETATYLIQNSLWWIGMTGVDAVRQDTLPYVPRSYWAKWTAALKREFPTVTIVGEVLDSRPELVSFFQGGRVRFDGVDSGVETLFDFPLHYAIRDVFAKGHSMSRLAQTLAADTNYVNPEVLVTLLGLHDTSRFMGEPGATPRSLQLAFTFLLTVRGTPMIYYGDEIAMNGGGDPDNRRDFPGGWREDRRDAFQSSGRTTTEAEVFAHVKHLLHLRQQLEPLRRGELQVLQAAENTFAFARSTETSGVLVAFNKGDSAQNLECAVVGSLQPDSTLYERLANGSSVEVRDGKISLVLPPHSAVILSPESPAVASDQGKNQARN